MEEDKKITKKPKSTENSEAESESNEPIPTKDEDEDVKAEVPKPVEAVKPVPEVVASAGPSRPKPREESPLIKALKSDQKHGILASYPRMLDCFAGIV
jgi:hypothetical protein